MGSAFSVWIVPGITLRCHVSWRLHSHFLVLPPSMLAAKSSDRKVSHRVCALTLTLNPKWCQAKSPGTQIAVLISVPSYLECIRPIHFHRLSDPLAGLLPLFSISGGHRECPPGEGQDCVTRENPGQPQTLQGRAAHTGKVGHLPSSETSIDIPP